jgi:hypothetical protein
MADGIHVRGDLTVTLRDTRTGQVVSTHTVRNKIVSVGVEGLVAMLAQNSGTDAANYQLTRLEIGTGTTAAAAGNIALQTARSPRKYIVLDDSARTEAGNQLTITAVVQDTDASLNGVAVSEAGLWMGPTEESQTLFARQVHAPVTKLPNQALEYRWVIQFTV